MAALSHSHEKSATGEDATEQRREFYAQENEGEMACYINSSYCRMVKQSLTTRFTALLQMHFWKTKKCSRR